MAGRSCCTPDDHNTARFDGTGNKVNGAHITANKTEKMVATVATEVTGVSGPVNQAERLEEHEGLKFCAHCFDSCLVG
jgi:hypothetical protein